jgi:hypothetical protein
LLLGEAAEDVEVERVQHVVVGKKLELGIVGLLCAHQHGHLRALLLEKLRSL